MVQNVSACAYLVISCGAAGKPLHCTKVRRHLRGFSRPDRFARLSMSDACGLWQAVGALALMSALHLQHPLKIPNADDLARLEDFAAPVGMSSHSTCCKEHAGLAAHQLHMFICHKGHVHALQRSAKFTDASHTTLLPGAGECPRAVLLACQGLELVDRPLCRWHPEERTLTSRSWHV